MRLRTILVMSMALAVALTLLGVMMASPWRALLAGSLAGALVGGVFAWRQYRSYRCAWRADQERRAAALADCAPEPTPAEPVESLGDERGHFLVSQGWCSTCDQEVEFFSRHDWLRDHFVCSNCGSIPRERALMLVIDSLCPDWRHKTIHESSPAGRGASARLARECRDYIASQYFPGETPGSVVNEMRCENLEALSFDNDSIDLHVTQDVLEHIFDPLAVFREIERTLKPGGMHVFTAPLINGIEPSRWRARRRKGEIVHLQPESYHGNPVGDGRSLVTIDWGFDIGRHIFEACGLFTQIIRIDDINKGIRAELIEVLVTIKPKAEGESLIGVEQGA